MNPQHTLPILKDDDFVIWDSHTIALYLLRKYGKNSRLYPTDVLETVALVDQRLFFEAGVLFPALRNTVNPVVYENKKALDQASFAKIKEAYDFTEKFLTKNWIAGDSLTLADVSCGATVSALNTLMALDQKQYPKTIAWLDRLNGVPFFAKINIPGIEEMKEYVFSRME